MPQSPAAKLNRRNQRETEWHEAKARIVLLEGVIRDVWFWRLRDSGDLDELARILECADEQHELNLALDGFEKGQL